MSGWVGKRDLWRKPNVTQIFISSRARWIFKKKYLWPSFTAHFYCSFSKQFSSLVQIKNFIFLRLCNWMRDFHFFYSLLLVSAYKKKRESEEKVEVVSTKFQVEKIVTITSFWMSSTMTKNMWLSSDDIACTHLAFRVFWGIIDA